MLTRPVGPRLLAQYARTLLRRAHAIPTFRTPPLDVGRVRLDPASRTVAVTGHEPQRLTQLEYRLLYVLMSNREHVVPVEVIVERVWGYSGEGNRDLVRGLVSRLRRKIELEPDMPRIIETIPGTGYRFSSQKRGAGLKLDRFHSGRPLCHIFHTLFASIFYVRHVYCLLTAVRKPIAIADVVS